VNRSALLALAALTWGGCRDWARTKQTPTSSTATPTATVDAGQEPWSCGGVHGEARLQRTLGRDGRLKLGAIADLHGDAAEASKAAAVLTNERVDAILALGDLGATEDEIAGVLSSLGQARLPLLALAGDAEPEDRFHAAVKRARAGGVDIVDLVDVRFVDAGDVEIVSAPGYRYSQRGCRYDARDLQMLATQVGRPGKPIVLAAHAPPRDVGADGVDRGYGDANVGDPAMAALATAIAPAAALCAHIDEAGGRAHGQWTNIGARVAVLEVAGGRARTRVLP
jgi:hypothetical protein